MIQLRAGFLPLLASAAVAACGGNNNAGAESALNLSVTPGTNSADVCAVGGGASLQVGDPSAPPAGIIADGSSASGAPIKVECAVSGDDTNGYTVNAEVTKGNLGTFTIKGSFPGENNGTVAQASNVSVQLNLSTPVIANFAETDCTVTFPNVSSGTQGIGAGKVAGTLSCPSAGDSTKATLSACNVSGAFLFQNCSH
ncbi:MAG TPA: hypothetical protein VGI39_11055 [Polyangiaceae bacterium]|jgi:hypothetical protein